MFAMLWRSGLSTVVVFNHDILSLVKSCWDKMYTDWKVCICQTRRLKYIYIHVIYFNDLQEGLVCILSPIGVCATTTNNNKTKKTKNSKEQRSVSSI